MSQSEAAGQLGISAQRYHDAEMSRLPERDVRTILAGTTSGGANTAPAPGELCALARRRAGWTLTVAQQALGVSRVTYLERERAGSADVVQLWRREGFKF